MELEGEKPSRFDITMTTSAPFELTSSAWQVIKSFAPPSEIEEIIYVIGRSLVEQVIELRQEVSLAKG